MPKNTKNMKKGLSYRDDNEDQEVTLRRSGENVVQVAPRKRPRQEAVIYEVYDDIVEVNADGTPVDAILQQEDQRPTTWETVPNEAHYSLVTTKIAKLSEEVGAMKNDIKVQVEKFLAKNSRQINASMGSFMDGMDRRQENLRQFLKNECKSYHARSVRLSQVKVERMREFLQRLRPILHKAFVNVNVEQQKIEEIEKAITDLYHKVDYNEYSEKVQSDQANARMVNKINELVLAVKTGFTDLSQELQDSHGNKSEAQYRLEQIVEELTDVSVELKQKTADPVLDKLLAEREGITFEDPKTTRSPTDQALHPTRYSRLKPTTSWETEED